MNDGATSAERVGGGPRGRADEDAIAYCLGQEVVVDVYVNHGEVRLTTTVKQQLVDGVKSWGDLDGRDPIWIAKGRLLLGAQWHEAQPLVGLSSGGRHQQAIDILALVVVDADLETVAQEDLWAGGAGGYAAGIDPGPGVLVLGKLPLAQKAKGSHAERQDGGHSRVEGEEASGAQDGTIAAEGGDEVDLVREVGSRVAARGGINGEGQVVVNAGGDAVLEDNIDVWIVVVQVLCEANGVLDDLWSMQLGYQEDVSRGLLPVKVEQANRGLVVQRADPVRKRGYISNLEQRGRSREGPSGYAAAPEAKGRPSHG